MQSASCSAPGSPTSFPVRATGWTRKKADGICFKKTAKLLFYKFQNKKKRKSQKKTPKRKKYITFLYYSLHQIPPTNSIGTGHDGFNRLGAQCRGGGGKSTPTAWGAKQREVLDDLFNLYCLLNRQEVVAPQIYRHKKG